MILFFIFNFDFLLNQEIVHANSVYLKLKQNYHEKL